MTVTDNQKQVERRERLLSASAQVARNVTSILDPDDLIARTVDIICDEFGFYYAGIFLLDEVGHWAVLKAGRGEPGRIMVEEGHRLEVGSTSMVGAAAAKKEPRIAFDVGKEAVHFKNPHLPLTRSELAMPLTVRGNVIGVLTVQSVEEAAFTDDDIMTLQALADQLAIAINNARLYSQNQNLLDQAERRARLLEAGAQVSRGITRILDLNKLLERTVDIICDAFGFYYAAIFLVDEKKEWAVLKAGRGEPGRIMIEKGHRLEVGGNSMIGAATGRREARIALDVGQEAVRFNNPLLPLTRSEMALPLAVGEEVIGALGVQSVEEAAFSNEDISALQNMADQLAIAITNARLLIDLEDTHKELVRTKTFEAIATATGEAIHWVGNKAAPIPGCVTRIREDMSRLVYAAKLVLEKAPEEVKEEPLAQLIIESGERVKDALPDTPEDVERLSDKPLRKMRRMLDVESVLEDLDIIENSGRTILNIKEDLIGPAREQKPRPVMIEDVVKDTVIAMALPPDMVKIHPVEEMLLVLTDPVQMNRVFNNLIKNAMEAMDKSPRKNISIKIERASDGPFVNVAITDTGCGIPPEDMDKIWVTFHTTKGDRGGTGLGLPACLQIMDQMGGKISAESEIGVGSTFTVSIPVYQERSY